MELGLFNRVIGTGVQEGGNGNERFRLATGGLLDDGGMDKMPQRECFKDGNSGTQRKGKV